MTSLTGKKILLTRAENDAASYIQVFKAQGAEVSAIPVIRVDRIGDAVMHERVAAIRQADLVVWTSSNAVRQLLPWLSEHRPTDLEFLRQLPHYVVGETTESILREFSMNPLWPHGVHDSDSLARSLAPNMKGKVVLLPKGTLAMETLPTILAQNGATVIDMIVYETHSPDAGSVAELRSFVARQSFDVICFFSPSGFRFFGQTISCSACEHAAVAAIGRTTESAIRSAGWHVDAVAETPSPAGLLQAVCDFFSKEEARLAEQ